VEWPTEQQLLNMTKVALITHIKSLVGSVRGLPDISTLDSLSEDQLRQHSKKSKVEFLGETLSRALLIGMLPDRSNIKELSTLRNMAHLFT
jgi:hypothetical protein